MVTINFECMIAGEKLSGSIVIDDENGKSFILSKHKEKIIKDVINKSLEITGYSYEMCQLLYCEVSLWKGIKKNLMIIKEQNVSTLKMQLIVQIKKIN